jgi:hypothetical protein
MSEQELEKKIAQQTEAIKAVRDACKRELSEQINNVSAAIGDTINDRVRTITVQVEDISHDIGKLRSRQERLDETDERQTVSIDGLLASDREFNAVTDKLTRSVDELQSRLDGSRIPQIKELSLEALRAQVVQMSDLLTGAGGQMPYREIQSNLQNTKFLGQVLRVLMSLFGVGGVVAAGSLLLGVGKGVDLSPKVNEQQVMLQTQEQRIKALESQIVRLESRLFEYKK